MSSTSTTWTTDTNTKSGTVQVYETNISVLKINSLESGDAVLELFADQGDDNADKWRMWASASDNDLHFSNYTSGAWVDKLVIADSGTITIGGDLDVDGTTNLDNTDIDGTLVVDGTNISLDSTTTLNIDNSNTSNGITIGTATSSVPISIGHTTSVVTINDELDVTGTVDINDTTDASSKTTGALKVDGGVGIALKLYVGTDLDVDGTTNLDVVDIDGAVQLDNTLTVGVDGTGYDVKFFGDTATNGYMLWDQSTDDLILGSASRLGIGTVSPEVSLEISGVGDNTTYVALQLTNTDYEAGQTGQEVALNFKLSQDGTMRDAARIFAGKKDTWAGNGTTHSYLAFQTTKTNSRTTKMVLDDDGYLGIGTSSPLTELHVEGASGAGVITISNLDTDIQAGNPFGAIQFLSNDGAGSPPTNDVVAKIQAIAGDAHTAGIFASELAFSTTNQNTLEERVRIDRVGNVGIGQSDPSYRFEVQGNVASNYVSRIFNDGNNLNRYGLLILAGKDAPDTDGDCRWIAFGEGDGGTTHAYIQYKHSGTTAELVAASDQRLKENIQNTSINGLDAINSLSFKEYNWIENSNRGQSKIPIGLIAQEVIEQGDKCNIVTKFEDEYTLKDGSKINDVQGIGYHGILLYLAKAVQELSAKVTALENN